MAQNQSSIKWEALEYLCKQGIHYFDIGGMAGMEKGPLDGLAAFKRGCPNDRRTVYLFGRILTDKSITPFVINSMFQMVNISRLTGQGNSFLDSLTKEDRK